MVVGTHTVVCAQHFVSGAPVERIAENENVITSDGFLDDAFAFAGTESDKLGVYGIGILAVPFKVIVGSVFSGPGSS